jgi:hypothetical protein
MAVYRLTDRKFSRLWRRSKDYSDHEIRYLARKRGLEISAHKQVIQVLDPKSKKVVANFQEVAQALEADNRSERSRLLGALHS